MDKNVIDLFIAFIAAGTVLPAAICFVSVQHLAMPVPIFAPGLLLILTSIAGGTIVDELLKYLSVGKR